jgi:hypothetical protein
MLRAIELENFKAFGTRSRVEFAPITLVYGQNSAGKSSILNALNLLKQTRMSRDQTALLLPRAERGLVDLGSFIELLHDHDSKRTLAIRLDFEFPQRGARELDGPLALFGIETGFRREHDQRDVSLAFLRVYGGGPGASAAEPYLQLEPRELTERELRDLRRFPYYTYRANRRLVSDLKAASCTSVTDSLEFWSAGYEQARKHSAEIVRALEGLRDEVTGESSGQMRLFRDGEPRAEHFEGAIDFYRSEFSVEAFVARRRGAAIGATVALDGFVPVPTPTRAEASMEYPETVALRYSRDGRVRRWRMFDTTEIIVEAGRALEHELERLFPLGPFRRAPKRLYIFTGTTPADVGYSGDLLPDLLFRKPGLLRDANRWLDRLDIGYHVDISPVGSSSNDLFEVRLRDTRRSGSTSIALPDVGFGISQILPFIVQTLASEEQTLTIEQPEVHIHPKLQADLADLLIAGIQPERNHRFIVETHSEHLILRLLRRIRETSDGELPQGHPGLTPNQLSVVYLERGAEGTKVHHLRVDERGEFVDKWPHGFFEERAQELF